MDTLEKCNTTLCVFFCHFSVLNGNRFRCNHLKSRIFGVLLQNSKSVFDNSIAVSYQ